jgi:hypothetical protein
MTVITKIDADVANKSARSATDPNGPTARSALGPLTPRWTMFGPPSTSAQITCCSTVSLAPRQVPSFPSLARVWKASIVSLG